ncbi:hypothetical protein AC249_AIPGENE13052 [Exaiptasia diaphana]|nr:hypothetical protein AC249_AIPGENE13052 [Exaiptasia diaphana]
MKKLLQFLNEKLPECKHEWEDFKTLLQVAAKHTFEKKKKVSNDWTFDDQDEEIMQLLDNRKLNRNELRECIRLLKNRLQYQEQAEKAERYSQAKNQKDFYATVKKIYGPKSKSSYPVSSKDGALLTSSEEIKDRWVELFSELLNQPAEVDENILEDIEQFPIDESLDAPITEAELDKALDNTKTGKSAGPDINSCANSTMNFTNFVISDQ